MLRQYGHQLLARPIACLALLFDIYRAFLRRFAINAVGDLLDCPALTIKRCFILVVLKASSTRLDRPKVLSRLDAPRKAHEQLLTRIFH
jgi:hypothetical protein